MSFIGLFSRGTRVVAHLHISDGAGPDRSVRMSDVRDIYRRPRQLKQTHNPLSMRTEVNQEPSVDPSRIIRGAAGMGDNQGLNTLHHRFRESRSGAHKRSKDEPG